MAPGGLREVSKATNRATTSSTEPVRSSARIRRRVEAENDPTASRIQPARMTTTRSSRIEMENSRSTNQELEEPVTKKLRSQLDPEDKNDCESELIDEPLNINDLPNEMLENILKYLDIDNFRIARLVCRQWYDLCARYGTLRVEKENFEPRKHLENCGFKRMSIYLYRVWSEISWKKIGPKIHSLGLQNCRLGDIVVKNVIVHCEYLESLEISFTRRRNKLSFCSAEMLEGLKLQRRKLKRLAFVVLNGSRTASYETEMAFGTWKKVFSAFFQIFPNVTSCKLDWSMYRTPFDRFICEFSREFDESVEPDAMVDVFTHFILSTNITRNSNWRNALNCLSQLRLLSINLEFMKSYSNADVVAVNNLFTDQKRLKTVNLKMRSPEIWKSLLFRIVDGCPELRELTVCHHWSPFHYFTEVDIHRFLTKTMHLDLLKIHGGLYRTAQLLKIADDVKSINPNLFPIVIQKFAHLEHVKIQIPITDAHFQQIFQHMVNLKSLDVFFSEENTLYAFTGLSCNSDEDSDRIGYSISRLQNLERLIIFMDSYVLCDEMFLEFDLPELYYLECCAPERAYILEDAAELMPSLKVLNFYNSGGFCIRQSLNSFITFCESMPHLREISIFETEFRIADMKKLFKRCPSLREVHTENGCIYYDPLSKQVRSTFTDNENEFLHFMRQFCWAI